MRTKEEITQCIKAYSEVYKKHLSDYDLDCFMRQLHADEDVKLVVLGWGSELHTHLRKWYDHIDQLLIGITDRRVLLLSKKSDNSICYEFGFDSLQDRKFVSGRLIKIYSDGSKDELYIRNAHYFAKDADIINRALAGEDLFVPYKKKKMIKMIAGAVGLVLLIMLIINIANSPKSSNARKCQYTENGHSVCNRPAKSGSNFCSFHEKYLNGIYNDVHDYINDNLRD